MKTRRTIAITCPNCGVRIVPTPKELRRWRLDAGLTQREMAKELKISAAYVTFLENGRGSPSATLIARYWKFIPP
jgi:predicted transcriptional regulator